MPDVLADTHVIVWALTDPDQLSSNASVSLAAAQESGRVFVSTVTFVELAYLVERRKMNSAGLSDLWNAVEDPGDPIQALSLSLDVARMVERIPRDVVPDMPDRIIAATSWAHNLPLISADGKIRKLLVPGFTVVW